MQAYDYYLKGKVLVDMGQSANDLTEARALLDQAIQIDASLARAHACKAFSYIVGAINLEAGEIRERRKLAMQCAEQAVALAPTDSVCHWAIAETAFWTRQYDRSCGHLARAISLNPNDADVLIISSFIHAACGDVRLAEAHMEMALERNPSHPRWYDWIRGATLRQLGRHEEALVALDLYGQPNADVLRLRAVTLVQLGRMEEARAAVQDLLDIKPDLSLGEARSIWDSMPDIEIQLAALQQAGLPS
jgi:adenylate cyclase